MIGKMQVARILRSTTCRKATFDPLSWKEAVCPIETQPAWWNITTASTSGGNASPTADASTSAPLSGDLPLTVQFSSSGSSDSDGDIVSYAWDFGDGNTPSEANPGHRYVKAGTFTAILTVTDDDAATDSDSVDVTTTAPAAAGHLFGV